MHRCGSCMWRRERGARDGGGKGLRNGRRIMCLRRWYDRSKLMYVQLGIGIRTVTRRGKSFTQIAVFSSRILLVQPCI
jgi:hypothetical protein